MKRTRTDFDRLIAELRFDRDQLAEIADSNRRAIERIDAGSTDVLDLYALGYTIHNVYGMIEGGCLRISKFFENSLPSDAWHKELLSRMLIDIPGLRPAFLDRDAYVLFDELRGFRHVFLNSYNRPLDRERTLLLQKKVPVAIAAFDTAVERFVLFLQDFRGRISE
ncbi:MAG: hypothetical protein Q8M76_06755 [Spirochaetaceae bacterium]|nr:hypothetical protein [Spirochaetaceae bacterium]